MTDQRIISFGDAIQEGLAESIARDELVFLMGEGIADPSSFWGTTAGIVERFGAQRVVEMPVAENGLTGIAIGAAMAGQRPVISFHRVEFALLAIEQIVNNAAKMHYVSNGFHKVPLVVRLVIGRGWGQGPEHSQSLEPLFAHFPGLKVIVPTFPSDAKGMLIAAVEDDNPVIFIEHRWLHGLLGHVPEGHYKTPLGAPRIVVEGGDITIVATSYMTLEAVRAAEVLKTIGCAVEVIDLNVLRPLILTPVFESLRKTGHLLTIDIGSRLYGPGAEVVASVVGECFDSLEAAPLRLGLPDHPTPSSRGLIAGYYPDANRIVAAVSEILGLDPERLEAAQLTLRAQRKDVPVDVPDPFFKGPF